MKVNFFFSSVFFYFFIATFYLDTQMHYTSCTCRLYFSMSSQTCSNSYIQSTAVSAPVSTSVFVQCTIKDAHKASLGSSGFEHQTEENLKWGIYCIWEALIFSKTKRKTKTVIHTICGQICTTMISDGISILDLNKKIVFLDTQLHVIFP